MTTTEDIKALLGYVLSTSALSSIDANKPLTQQGIDSLDLMTLLMSVEDRYGIVIPTERIGSLRTLSDVVGFLDEAGRHSDTDPAR
jgi:acyl carrier protein